MFLLLSTLIPIGLNEVKIFLSKYLEQAFNEYGLIIAFLVIGIILGWHLKLFLADRKFIQQINLRIEERDVRISQLNLIIDRRLNDITVEKKDRTYFNRIKKFFKNLK